MAATPATPDARGRVLIADDDAHTRNLLRELVEGWGYLALVAADGEQALNLASPAPDLALLDLLMPKLDGFSVLQRLRAADGTRDMPVILLTAAGEVDDKIKGMGLGADDYVTKPFRIADLQRRVEAALDKRRKQKEAPAAEAARDLDPLTGVGTFPQLKEALTYEVERARRYGRCLTALIVAVDDPPLLFDHAGRGAASELLQKLAQSLRKCFRIADRLFRIDVEAFVLLLPETTAEGAEVAASRFARALLESPLTAPGGGGKKITVSVGIADFPRFGKDRADDLVRAAHHALQRVQRDGPGRVGIAQDGEAGPPGRERPATTGRGP